MGFLLAILFLGLNNLRLHLLRSVLTSLGIILGVAAVIIMVSIGEGRKQQALREIQALGATNIIVRSQKPPESASMTGGQQTSFMVSYGLRREDLRRLQSAVDDAADIVALKAVGDEVTYGGKRMISQAFGTTPDLKRVANLELARGRYLSDEDIEQRNTVAVIGHEVAEQFFPLEDPIGKEFRIGMDSVFRVVGVLRQVGLAGGAGNALVGRSINKDIHIPITTAELVFSDLLMRRASGTMSFEEIQISELYLTAPDTADVIPMSQRIRRVLEVGHPDLDDVEIVVPWELLEQAKRETMVMNAMLIAIAAISLLVGGIGIMNIMLASVTERTREIGIRRALGATRQHIVMQFLVETGSLSAVGGLVGIALGVGISVGIEEVLPWLMRTDFMQQWFDATVTLETEVTTWSIITSFIVAATVGLGFGIYPAVVASRQDPIVALRHD